MRPLRELRQGVWYEIRTAVNNRKQLFRLRQAVALFARVLGETAERFEFEIRALSLEEELLVFCIKPKDGFQLPRIMQWLKQTFAVRYNLRHGWSGHVWGDRYRSKILEGEPHGNAERRTVPVTGAEAEGKPFSEAAEVSVRSLTVITAAGVRHLQRKPAEIPRNSALSPG